MQHFNIQTAEFLLKHEVLHLLPEVFARAEAALETLLPDDRNGAQLSYCPAAPALAQNDMAYLPLLTFHRCPDAQWYVSNHITVEAHGYAAELRHTAPMIHLSHVNPELAARLPSFRSAHP